MAHVRNQLLEFEKRINKLEKDIHSQPDPATDLEEIYRRLRRLEMVVKPPVKQSISSRKVFP